MYDEDCESEEGVKAKKIDGEIYLMVTSSDVKHSKVLDNIHYALRRQLGNGKCRAFMDCIDFVYHLLIDDENCKTDCADDVIICDQDKIKRGSYYGKPKFVLEVISPSTVERDRITKAVIYEEAGISEYWIANPKDETLDVYRLIDGRYKLD